MSQPQMAASVRSENPFISKQLESNRQTQDAWIRFARHRESITCLCQTTSVERLIKRMRSHSLTLVGYSFDVVLSAGLLTQMLQTVEDAKLKPDETLELALELRR
jgi:hypothetical protein